MNISHGFQNLFFLLLFFIILFGLFYYSYLFIQNIFPKKMENELDTTSPIKEDFINLYSLNDFIMNDDNDNMLNENQNDLNKIDQKITHPKNKEVQSREKREDSFTSQKENKKNSCFKLNFSISQKYE